MFEKYTEPARRSVFFARYEASQLGSRQIEPAHLLLGILRESPELRRDWLGGGRGVEELRSALEKQLPRSGEKIATSVDLPMSNACKRVLAYSADEAERLAHHDIDVSHLFLGLLRENGPAAEALSERGVTLEAARSQMLAHPFAPGGHGLQSAAGPLLQHSLRLQHLLRRLPESRLAAAARLLQALCEERVEIAGSDSQGRFSFTFEPKGRPVGGTPEDSR
jgi:ATP-dependent Clp protease ATP-binding subunit ClpC